MENKRYIVEVFLRKRNEKDEVFETYTFDKEEDAIKRFEEYVESGCMDYRGIPNYKKREGLCTAIFAQETNKNGNWGYPYYVKSFIWNNRY